MMFSDRDTEFEQRAIEFYFSFSFTLIVLKGLAICLFGRSVLW